MARLFCRLALALAAALSLPAVAAAHTIHYALTAESRVAGLCADCEAEPLAGSFDLTTLPAGGPYAAEALTAVAWQSKSFQITGAGFLQRIASDRVAVVIDVRVNGDSVLLTSGRRQRSTPGEIRIHLATPRDRATGYRVELVAVPVLTDGPDADQDSVPDDLDNCPTLESADQSDADSDGVGDACDACPDTSFGNPVAEDGCAPAQHCPCEGPAPDEEWQSSRQYAMCVARELKRLFRAGKLTRPQVRRMMQDAVRSGCGERVVASLG